MSGDKKQKDPYARGSGVPHPVDVHVGNRVKQRRSLVGMSQTELANALNVSFQQLQKYEDARNRVSASRLYQLAQILGVPITYFYEKFSAVDASVALSALGFADNAQASFTTLEEEQLHEKETHDLLRLYYSVQDPKVRKNIFNIVKDMAQNLGTAK